MKNIIIFASGRGSNCEAILEHFRDSDNVQVVAIVTNKNDAGVINLATDWGIKTLLLNKTILESPVFLDNLEPLNADLLVLAGFLLKIPDFLIEEFPNKIVNIHPSLLPKYGGKGMYGSRVHEAVLENEEKESGISIHLVNEEYDQGTILLQKSVAVVEYDTVETLADKIHDLEHEWFPKVVESLL